MKQTEEPMKQLISNRKTYRFDFLEKIDYTCCLHGILSMMQVRIEEAKKRNPNAKYEEQEKAADDLIKIYCWVSALFEEKELMYRHNMNLERLNLELKHKVSELEKELKILNEIDKL